MMDKKQKENILTKYYFDVKLPGSYLGAKKLHSILEKKYPKTFTVYFIQKWLNNQDSYGLQKQVRHNSKLHVLKSLG